MVEECACCRSAAPSWDCEDYVEWMLEVTPGGTYVGVVCPACFAGEGLAFLGVELSAPSVSGVVRVLPGPAGGAEQSPLRAAA